MFGSFFKKQNTFDFKGTALLIDIRNSSVGGALVSFSKNAPPTIIKTFRDRYFFETTVDAEEFVRRAELSLKKVLDMLLHKHKLTEPIVSVEVFYGAPWYKAALSNVQIEQTTPTEFTEEYLQTITEKNNSHESGEETVVEKEIVAVMLNGYKVEKPFDKEATNFDVSFFTSLIAKETKASFETIIKKYTRTHTIHSHSHPFAMYSVINKKIHPPKHYAILDVSGEMIEMSIVKDDHFRKIVSIPYGSHSFIRSYAAFTKTDFQAASLKLTSLLHEDVDAAHKATHKDFAKDIQHEWVTVIQQSLQSAKVELIPSTIFVSGDEEIKSLVLHMLEDVEVYAGAFKIAKKPQVQFIASGVLKTYCSYQPNVIEDHQLAAEAVFVELLRVDK